MSIAGGLRARLIKDNLYNTIYDGLEDLGWFGSGRSHAAVTVVPEPIDQLTEILPNKVGIAMENVTEQEIELGSTLAEHTWVVFVDVMAESADLGLELSTDIRDILRGRIASIGRDAPVVNILNLADATPSTLFTVQILNLEMERDRSNQPHRKYWWTIGFDVEDSYLGELDV